MKLLRNNCCLAFLFISGFVNSQIEFSSIPVDFQLIPRYKNNTGKFVVAGKSLLPEYTEVHTLIKDLSNDSLIENKITTLDANQRFSVPHQLPVQLAEYELKIYLRDSFSELLVKIVTRLTAGDYFMIAGQSNATAGSETFYAGTEQMTAYPRLWIRGLGTNENHTLPTYPCTPQSFEFYQSNSNWLQNGFVGTWGLTLQFNLSIQTGVPNCFINGARPGSSMEENLASHTPSDKNALDTCKPYDRLYQKVIHHHLDSAIRALFWYQGESDATLSYANSCDYLNRFHALYTSWKKDYPNLEKIFLLQLNAGCCEINLSLLREIQRKISYKYNDIVIMSTFSSDIDDRLADHCHYTIKGYNKISDNLLPLVKKFIYHDNTDEKKILPPKILRAYYSNTYQLCLEFDMNVVVQQSKKYFNSDNGTAFIKDYFYGEDLRSLNVISVTSQDNLVYLNLPSVALRPKKITYLPHSYTYIPTLYTGPWILNKSNDKLAALSFYDFPVTSQTNNDWEKTWSNFGSGEIDGEIVNENTIIYKGDFDGDGSEELFFITETGFMHLFKFKQNNWNLIWSRPGDLSPHSQIYHYKNNLIAGDFDGDGKDELFGNIETQDENSQGLFRFSGQEWVKVWAGNGEVFTDFNSPGRRLYAGDFDGDGKDELLASAEKPDKTTVEFNYNGVNFVKTIDAIDFTGRSAFYTSDFSTADYTGDGATDLMRTNGPPALFSCKNKTWKRVAIDNEETAFDQKHFSPGEKSKIISENIDEGKEAEIMIRQTGSQDNSVTFMHLKQTSQGTSGWFKKQGPDFVSSLNDWPVDDVSQTVQRFYFVKAVASEPAYLMAMRKESCGYFMSMYKFSGDGDFPLENSLPGLVLTNDDFLIYPNPTNGLVTLVMYPGSKHTVSVYNLQGALLITLKNQDDTLVLDLGSLEQGLYLVKVENTNGTCVKKVVVK